MSDSSEGIRRQYRDSTNLRARAALHARFGISRTSWYRWLFDHYVLPPDARILEVGCGPGDLWDRNRDRIAPGWQVLLTDLSPGMVDEARAVLADSRGLAFGVVDAQAIPCPAESFDAVIANQMVSHVPDLAAAVREFHRVLRPGGHLYVAASGRHHMKELFELLGRFDPSLARAALERPDAFGLETATQYLGPWFTSVTVQHFEDRLVVTEAEPLVAYVYSMSPPPSPAPGRRADFRAFVERELVAQGAIRISKASGIVIATRRS